MRRKILVVLLLASIFFGGVMGVTHQGPAPGHGDGVPEGPEWGDEPMGPQNPDSSNAPGPAPNSGDGVPDGPGW